MLQKSLHYFLNRKKIDDIDITDNENMQGSSVDIVKVSGYAVVCFEEEDSGSAQQLANELEKLGITCQLNFHKSSKPTTHSNIQDCSAFILILTHKATLCQSLRNELSLAENRNKLILVVAITKQEDKISLDPALQYTLAKAPYYYCSIQDGNVNICARQLMLLITTQLNLSSLVEEITVLKRQITDAESLIITKDEQIQILDAKFRKRLF